MSDPTSGYFPVRHAPRPEFAEPTGGAVDSRGATFTQHQDPYGTAGAGTAAITNNASRTSASERLSRARHVLTGSTGDDYDPSPLGLHKAPAIIEASGLGKVPGEADPPSQGIEEQPDGSMVHHRANSDGSVTSVPVGAQSPDYFGES